MLGTYIHSLYYVLLFLAGGAHAFMPHPLVAYSVMSSTSVTHAEITQLGIIRSLARFFYDTRLQSNITNGSTVDEEKYFATEHTIDDLYEFAYPEYNEAQVQLNSLPLKFVIDSIMTHDALVDFDDSTKLLASAHFDDETFANSSRRILQLRQIVINNTIDVRKDLSVAQQSLGQLLHTLQDFYSHSNWVEMGNSDINELLGVSEIIGSVAAPNQSTCSSDGCTKIERSCTLWQEITLGVCPLVYYDCQNNILSEINDQRLLTSGYYAHDHDDSNQLLTKPTDVVKCSHGSVMDASSHIPAIGGINKDSYSLILSPHSNLHKTAVDLAVKATERFLNDLRRDLGDANYDRLLGITPTSAQSQAASNSVSQGDRFHLFTPYLSISVNNDHDNSFWARLKRYFKNLFQSFRSITGSQKSVVKGNIDQPTYDLTDQGVNLTDTNSVRVVPYIARNENFKRKKRLIDLIRRRR